MAKGFFKDMRSELKKVVWPTKKQIINNTLWVMILVIVVSLLVLFMDLLLEEGDKALWNLINNENNEVQIYEDNNSLTE